MGYEVDFLPVGETKCGDAVVLRFGNLYGERSEQTVVLIDGGYLSTGPAIVRHIRDHYGTNVIDIAVSTHPDADHVGGLEVILQECQVGQLWMHRPWVHTDEIARMFRNGRVTDEGVRRSLRESLEGARDLERLAMMRRIPIVEPFAGCADPSESLIVVGPTLAFYRSLLPYFRGTPQPRESVYEVFFRTMQASREGIGMIREDWYAETLADNGRTTAENDSSVILLLEVDGRALLFTADAGIPALTGAADLLDRVQFDWSKLEFIQVPHHGSQRNVGPQILDRLVGPPLQREQALMTAFVSVTDCDDPKHPSKKVMNAFRRRGAVVHATAGVPKRHHYNAPPRQGWVGSAPLPFYNAVEG
jgi:beta-lactamase superfamily II metal-dependent hydrolase